MSYEILSHNPVSPHRVIELVKTTKRRSENNENRCTTTPGREADVPAGPARQTYSLVREICLPVLSLAFHGAAIWKMKKSPPAYRITLYPRANNSYCLARPRFCFLYRTTPNNLLVRDDFRWSEKNSLVCLFKPVLILFAS